MPVEIRELHIKARVETEPTQQRGVSSQELAKLKQEILRDCEKKIKSELKERSRR